MPTGRPDSRLRCAALRLGYDGAAVVDGLDLEIPDARITVVLGPNGSGKSTVLRGLARMLAPRGGAVLLDGEDLRKLPTRRVATVLSSLPQAPAAPEGLVVAELVSYGRYPHRRGATGTLTAEDRAQISQALELTGLAGLADRPLGSLSGGQRQRAWIAMAIAQDAQILLLDEPTTFLDVAYQFEVLELLRRLNRERGRTVVMVMHDINHAARYADHIVAMADGAVVASGPPNEVITAPVLARVFGIDAEILTDPRTGAPLCVPYAGRPVGADLAGLYR